MGARDKVSGEGDRQRPVGALPPANARITLRNLIAARWVLVALVGAAVILAVLAGDSLPAGLIPRSEHPLAIMICVAVWAGLNLGSMSALRHDRASEGLAVGHLLIDVVALTFVLALSGGPANPFTTLYFLPITLATQVSPRWTWALAGFCVACFAGLFAFAAVEEGAHAVEDAVTMVSMEHGGSPMTHDGHDEHDEHDGHGEQAMHDMHDMHTGSEASAQAEAASGHGEHFEGHQRGMWVAFGIVGALITVFVQRIALALARQRDELARLRQVALEDRHLTAIGALAGGAAHELGTPLGTIALLVDELPHMSKEEADEARETVREQVARCKLIVSRMASPELRVSALGVGHSWPITALLTELDALPTLEPPLRVEARGDVATRHCRQPLEVLSQLLRELVSNAAEACRQTGDHSRGVSVALEARGDRLIIEVRDQGVGMDAEGLAAAFDPFHSTRPEGQGMGLGLYLARAHLRQLGGSIELDSTPGEGTTAHVELPLAHADMEDQP